MQVFLSNMASFKTKNIRAGRYLVPGFFAIAIIYYF